MSEERTVACALTGDDAGRQAERWTRLLRDAGLGRAADSDGVRVRFRDGPAVERELRELAAMESRCCGWARWEVHRAGGELVMRASPAPGAASGAAAALHAMFRAAG